MTMPNFMGALGPEGPPPDEGPPPEPEGLTPLEPPAEEEADTGGEGEAYTTSLDALDGAEEALHAFIKLDPDAADRAVAARCLQEILKLKAANQQAESGGGLKSLQRALQGAG